MFSCLFLSLYLFTIGSFGMFLTRKHMIIMLISLELILLSSGLLFATLSIIMDDILGQIFSLLILTIALVKVLLV